MNCKTHPSVPAVDRCVGCAEAFCENCLVEIHGQKYCISCKTMAIDGPPVVDGRVECAEAGEALKYAIIGLFCCGIIFSPMAISKGTAARRAIQADPTLVGEGKATVAIMLGIAGLSIWILGLISRAIQRAHG